MSKEKHIKHTRYLSPTAIGQYSHSTESNFEMNDHCVDTGHQRVSWEKWDQRPQIFEEIQENKKVGIWLAQSFQVSPRSDMLWNRGEFTGGKVRDRAMLFP